MNESTATRALAELSTYLGNLIRRLTPSVDSVHIWATYYEVPFTQLAIIGYARQMAS